MRYLLVFLSTLFADVAWASWVMDTSERRPWQAATWGAMIILLGAVAVTAYVDDWRYLGPAAAGAWFGTFFSVRWTPR